MNLAELKEKAEAVEPYHPIAVWPTTILALVAVAEAAQNYSHLGWRDYRESLIAALDNLNNVLGGDTDG